ncbi:MAG: UDP-N-acetylglucosamine 1-carboxyvinyltransferase [Deltaproteobacteria bacterium]|nr:UDP-N-acetylglucosamine 1-carboxyvinyltransferase [Deltaproteobacteria bacterium]MBI3295533.1 UDP-N-acetylglucosamine 1-carboxyvinyltransferase [Deltaproteobacteria bacterium]
MDTLRIKGPARLSGAISVSGSKNAALPLLFGSILFDKPVVFENVPRLWDIETTLSLLASMGAQSEWNKEAARVTIWPTITKREAPYDLVRRMRAGILALGPLVAKFGEARVSLPGGCAIGARPVNFHIDALKQFGVTLDVEEGYVVAKVRGQLKGAHIVFPQVTVTGTENILFVATLAEGHTKIENAACEPEVVALGEMLRACGAKIAGLGTPVIDIEGTSLSQPPGPIVISPDRIETGTWVAAAVATRGHLTIRNTDASKLSSVLDAFRAMGTEIRVPDPSVIEVMPGNNFLPIDVQTAPYPFFATDMQAQIMTVACLAKGTSRVRETIFENRFMHVAELRRMGAKISVRRNLATIEGPVQFKGAPVMATDLRASASLVIAALCAQGTTQISRIYHLDRGYQRLDEKLKALDVDVERVKE